MKSTAKDRMYRSFRRMADLERKNQQQPPFSRVGALAEIDYNQLTVRSSQTLCDTDGVFWFIPGFSIVGGGDKVKP